MIMKRFSIRPSGPFDLACENQFFGGWLTLDEGKRIIISMPIEGWTGSATIVMHQDNDGAVHGEVYSPEGIAEKAWHQALASLSLDIDGKDWPEIGKQDPFIGRLQKEYEYMRPVLFHSPYEAAISLLIGHRISIKQRRAIMQRLSEEHGDQFVVEGKIFYAFPDPQTLLSIQEIKGLNAEKILRIHRAAQAALDGLLDREYLRSLPIEDALKKLLSLRGVGDFFSQAILFRGAGIVTVATNDANTLQTVQKAYGLGALPSKEQFTNITQMWHPYEMWATVLLHIWVRREMGGFKAPR
jgi:DNA-3-methyladenine glycosylase II